MGSADHLPDEWIRKESTSRPNRFYYFNTKTGKSQWESPKKETNKMQKESSRDASTKKSSKIETSSKGRTSVQNRLKVNDKSKDVKKVKTKTPAQDRLQKMIDLNKTVAGALKESVDMKTTTLVSNKRKKMTIESAIAKKPHIVSVYNVNEANSAELTQPQQNKDLIMSASQQKIRKYDATKIVKTDEIPPLFPPKNPAQERLKSIQQNLRANVTKEVHDSIQVFHSSFGINDSIQSSICDDIDEQMEWESCESPCSFQELENMVVDILMDSAYIVPDTNVFLDSLVSVKNIIEKDLQYSILIPFVVLQELDSLKRKSEKNVIRSQSSRAIKFIYEELKVKNHRLQGQKAIDDKNHLIDVTSPDDRILNCCLQLKNQSKEVILVTNDKNLSNKAMLSDIEAITSKTCLEKFQS